MTDQQDTHIATPQLRHRPSLSLVWLVPLVTLLIGGWLVYQTLNQQGPSITIRFVTAEGIEAGTTRIRYKDVEIGMVDSVRFASDFKYVELTARMTRSAESLLNEGTRFWVVRPRLTLREVSGLGTLLSGAYIELDPGKGTARRKFTGLETPPVITAEDKGHTVLLQAPRLNSIGIGSPIYYQGIVTGEVLGYQLTEDKRGVLIHAFIKSPYDQLLADSTRFWNVSGMDLSMDSEGFRLRTESLESLMFGGIAFDTPSSLTQDEPLSRTHFPLWPSRQQIEQSGFTEKVPFVLYFEGSVRGLSVNAPVEFNGMRIGSVRDIRLEYHPDDQRFMIPVLVEIEPDRITWLGEKPDSEANIVPQLIERGLRARLQTGNLLTGQLFVELVMRPDSPIRLLETRLKASQLPTIPGQLDELTSSVRSFLTRLNKVDIDKIAEELHGTLAGTNKLLNHRDLDKAIQDLGASLASLRGLMKDLEKRSGPISRNLENALGAVAPALEQAGRTMNTLDEVIQPNSQLHFRVIRMADELIETARSIRAFVNLLERSPESVIFGKQEEQ